VIATALDWAAGEGFGPFCEAHDFSPDRDTPFKSAAEYRQRHLLRFMKMRMI